MADAAIINKDAVRAAPVSREPYSFFLASDVLNHGKVAQLREEFPNITKPGFLTVDDVEVKGAFKQLIDELEGPELTALLSEKFGIDLSPYPRLTTIRKISQAKDGRIHTDGPSKVMTLLVYMNDAWDDGGAGRLRVLRGPDSFDDMVLEVPPTMGTMFAFLRADNSWHGHPPFAGERRVVQVAWVKDAEELERKKKRNSMAKLFKGIFGR
ncbi:proline hydroxylase [Alsobacter soli]|uniref:Proline hydroxylase n=1 Tax=Alsobacter soli TaxID=2109933 RepID=A0A2T1HSV6_9HYPH|nr:2OG-Fe(II) oxygenase [Alsobacter soli]PSC04735.1 proline hydroxylase [Alsobacter soli]